MKYCVCTDYGMQRCSNRLKFDRLNRLRYVQDYHLYRFELAPTNDSVTKRRLKSWIAKHNKHIHEEDQCS